MSAIVVPHPIVVTLVTGNAGKLSEIESVLSDLPEFQKTFCLRSRSLDVPEIQASSPEKVSEAKCRLAASLLWDEADSEFRRSGGEPVIHAVLVEDSSLCFGAWAGLPGCYIRWFWENLGGQGLNRALDNFEDRSAWALSLFSFQLLLPDSQIQTFVGRLDGTIVEPRGQGGFDWDSIFQPTGETRTFAEMTRDEKNSCSPRRVALDQFRLHVEEIMRARASETSPSSPLVTVTTSFDPKIQRLTFAQPQRSLENLLGLLALDLKLDGADGPNFNVNGDDDDSRWKALFTISRTLGRADLMASAVSKKLDVWRGPMGGDANLVAYYHQKQWRRVFRHPSLLDASGQVAIVMH